MPRTYESQGIQSNISAIREGSTYRITGTITSEPNLKKINRGLSLVTFTVSDETGRVEVVFFNQPYLKRMYKENDVVFISGTVKRNGRRLQFVNPNMEKPDKAHEGLNPVYALTAGLSQKVMRILVNSALQQYHGSIPEILPNDFRSKHHLAEINYSLAQIHFPDNEKTLSEAKRRLIFEELLFFNIALFSHESKKEKSAISMNADSEIKKQFLSKLNYVPTTAQFKVMEDIENDL